MDCFTLTIAAGYSCSNVQKCPNGYLPMTTCSGLNVPQFRDKPARVHTYTE